MMHNLSSATRSTVILMLGLLLTTSVPPVAAASGDSLPDTWSGVVRLWWDSGIPVDSPLHEQTDHVSMRYTKRWSLRVVFKVSKRHPNQVVYTSRWASVDYVETSATVGKKGAVSTNEVWKIEADNSILDGHQCNLTLVVDSTTKKYRIEVGAFEIPNAAKTGQIVMSVAGRTVSEPINKETDVIEPVRFEGGYAESRPLKLTGEFDAHVDPPPGVDITHDTLGGTVIWELYRGSCPDARTRCYEDADSMLNACLRFMPDVHGGRCEDEFGLDSCLMIMAADRNVTFFNALDCVDLYCSWEFGTEEIDRATEAIKGCIDAWILHATECDRLCP